MNCTLFWMTLGLIGIALAQPGVAGGADAPAPDAPRLIGGSEQGWDGWTREGAWRESTAPQMREPAANWIKLELAGDQTGVARSPIFTVQGEAIRFWFAGQDPSGSGERVGCVLRAADSATPADALRWAAVPNDQFAKVEERTWHVRDLKGRRVQFEIAHTVPGGVVSVGRVEELSLPAAEEPTRYVALAVPADADPTSATRERDGAAAAPAPRPMPRHMPTEAYGVPFMELPSLMIAGRTTRIPVGARAERIVLLGMNTPEVLVWVGTELGRIRVHYRAGAPEEFPLIHGESLWYGRKFGDYPEPFLSFARPAEALTAALRVYPAIPPAGIVPNGVHLAAITPRDDVIDSIELVGPTAPGIAPGQAGVPEIRAITIVPGAGDLPPGGIELAGGRLPDELKTFMSKRGLRRAGEDEAGAAARREALKSVLYVTPENFPREFAPLPRDRYPGPVIAFSGDALAQFYSNVYLENAADMKNRVDAEGVYRTSTRGAPWYGYDGYGGGFTFDGKITPSQAPGFYHGQAWSRDLGRTLMELSALGDNELALKCLDWSFAMARLWEYSSDPRVLLEGQRLPRHMGRILQLPSTTLGEGCFENDGHGMVTLACYNAWRRLPAAEREPWLRARWHDVSGLGDWYVWQFANPKLSRASDVLWSDSEGSGWPARTGSSVYVDAICIEALRALTAMAMSVGERDAAARWQATADSLERAGLARYVIQDPKYGRMWDPKAGGWDPPLGLVGPLIVPPDRLGFDPRRADPGARGLNEAAAALRIETFQLCGMGYGSGFITQAALLTDRMNDARRLFELTAKAIWSPVYRPYIIPEIGVPEIGTRQDDSCFTRLGDLGNGVQQAEIMKSLRILAGVDDSDPELLRIVPRPLPQWDGVEVKALPVIFKDAAALLEMTLRKSGRSFALSLAASAPMPKLALRIGPFEAMPERVKLVVNGAQTEATTEQSGDATWVRFTADAGLTRLEAALAP